MNTVVGFVTHELDGGGILPSDIRLEKYHDFNRYHGGAWTPRAPEGEEMNEELRRKRPLLIGLQSTLRIDLI